jgi:hypothetical protein
MKMAFFHEFCQKKIKQDVEEVVESSEGDLRHAITTLQVLGYLSPLSLISPRLQHCDRKIHTRAYAAHTHTMSLVRLCWQAPGTSTGCSSSKSKLF